VTDQRLRALRRAANASGAPADWQALVWEHVRTGQPLNAQLALVATDMADRLGRGKDVATQTEIDAALLASRFLQLHYPTARLRRVLIRCFGSMKEATNWFRTHVGGRPWPGSGPELRFLMQAALSAVQLGVHPFVHGRIAPQVGILAFETSAIQALDGPRIGTPFYSGLAYFWHHDYRHDLRDTSLGAPPEHVRKAAHDALLKAGLPLDGSSQKHQRVINRFVGPWFRQALAALEARLRCTCGHQNDRHEAGFARCSVRGCRCARFVSSVASARRSAEAVARREQRAGEQADRRAARQAAAVEAVGGCTCDDLYGGDRDWVCPLHGLDTPWTYTAEARALGFGDH